MSMFIGEALVGDGNEIAHIDLLIGSKDGPVGTAFANALAGQIARAHQPAGGAGAEPALQAGHGPHHQGDDQGRRPRPCRCSARPRRPSPRPSPTASRPRRHQQVPGGGARDRLRRLHPLGAAKDNAKIYKYNYEATKLSIQRAMKGEPKIDEILAKKDTAKHPFRRCNDLPFSRRVAEARGSAEPRR